MFIYYICCLLYIIVLIYYITYMYITHNVYIYIETTNQQRCGPSDNPTGTASKDQQREVGSLAYLAAPGDCHRKSDAQPTTKGYQGIRKD